MLALLATTPAASPVHEDELAVQRGPVHPVPEKPGAMAPPHALARPITQPAIARVRGGKVEAGTLAGKTVYLSAGHGWHYTSGAWRTQRGNTHDLVEDFITIESVNEYLIAYLHAMGAYVVPIRESDPSPHAVIVDDGEATLEGEVAELETTDRGWGVFPTPLADVALRPFHQGGARAMTAAEAETGRAVFSASVPASGYYNVYIAYVQGPDRVADAHVIVRHAGGESHLRVDQRRHGSTWMLLGRWYFEEGGPAAVAFANDSATPGATISFDAIRIGGGMAPHERGGVTTGRPLYESAAQFSTQLLGAPPSVYNYFNGSGGDDVAARPRFAAWEHEAGEDAIFLSWHTNAPDPGRGTLSIAYGNTYPCCAGLDDFAGTAGSLELLHAVHDELIADLRAGYDPEWRNRGKVTASLGEVNPNHNSEMPGILVEVAFHSTAADAEALREPGFRRIAARAMAQGIAKYFAAKDGRTVVLPPEPPTAVRVENAGEGALRVSWRPPASDPGGGDAPARYRVYVSENGYGFDDGIDVDGESYVLEGLPPGALRFVRVAAVNDGGVSLPTEVVGARCAVSGVAPVLVVGGYDRLDKHQMIAEEAPLLGVIDRMRLERMNDGTYAARHGRAIADAGFAFDGATDEAVVAGDIDLTRYGAVDWFAGEQANADALPREQIAALLSAGGKLLLSGAELVWALETRGTADEQAFARDVLRASLVADSAGTYDVLPGDGPFAALPPLSFQDTAPGGYDAESADVLAPGEGATAVLAYAGDVGAAAIAWEHGILFGFPLELVQGADARAALMEAALLHFGIPKDVEPEDVEPTGCGCASNRGGDAAGVLLLALAVGLVVTRRRR